MACTRRAGDTSAEIIDAFPLLTTGQIERAMAFCAAHRDEVDAHIAEGEALCERWTGVGMKCNREDVGFLVWDPPGCSAVASNAAQALEELERAHLLGRRSRANERLIGPRERQSLV